MKEQDNPPLGSTPGDGAVKVEPLVKVESADQLEDRKQIERSGSQQQYNGHMDPGLSKWNWICWLFNLVRKSERIVLV